MTRTSPVASLGSAAVLACLVGCGAPEAAGPLAPTPPVAGTGTHVAEASLASAAPAADARPDAAPKVADPCAKAKGNDLPIKLLPQQFHRGTEASGVFTSAAQYRKASGSEPPASVDFARERVVRVTVSERPSATIASVVETEQEIVVGVNVPVYCGGAMPPSPTFDVVVPVSGKTVRVQECRQGVCSGPPRP